MKHCLSVLCLGLTLGIVGSAWAGDSLAFVSRVGPGDVERFDAETGQYLGSLGLGFFSTNQPSGIAFATDGQLYVGDFGANGIVRFNPFTGVYEGTIGAGFATLITAVAADADGNIDAASQSLDAIVRFNASTGLYEGLVGAGYTPTGYSGLVVDSTGNLYANAGGTIYRFSAATGQFEGTFGSGFAGNYGMAVDGGDNLYAPGNNLQFISRFSASTGQYEGIVGAGLLTQAAGIAFDPKSGSLLVNDYSAGYVRRFDAFTGQYQNSFGFGIQGLYGIAIVPEPSTLATGAIFLFAFARRRKHSQPSSNFRLRTFYRLTVDKLENHEQY